MKYFTKQKIFALLGTILISGGLYYYQHPSFNLTTYDGYVAIGTVLIIFVIFNFGTRLLSFDRDSFNNVSISSIPLALKGIILVIVAVVVLNIVNSPIISSGAYSSRIDVKMGTSEDIPQVDYHKLAVIDRDASMALGDKVMGEMDDLVSQFSVAEDYTEISYKDSIYRVTPLTYASFFKWNNNHDDGIPAYILVNSTTGKAEIVRLKDLGMDNMKYVPSAFFGENLGRHVQMNNPMAKYGEPSFEIDEKGHPYYIIPEFNYSLFNMRKRVTGITMLDPISGDLKHYDVKDVPKWVDRVFPADLAIEEIDSYGKYQSGFINSVIGQSGVIQSSSGYNYLEKDGDIYLYTGITSTNSDSSNIGFLLVNLRTHKAIRIKSSGADESSAMNSAKGKVKNYGYEASFPILVNVENHPVYFMGLKDSASITKMYAMVSAEDYQKVATISVDDDKNDLLNSMKSLLDVSSSDKSKKETVDVVVTNVHYMVFNEKNYLFFSDDQGNNYKYVIDNTSDEALFIQDGMNISIQYSGDTVRSVSKITIK